MRAARAASLCSCSETGARRDAEVAQQHADVTRVSSAAITSALPRMSIAAQRQVAQISERCGNHI